MIVIHPHWQSTDAPPPPPPPKNAVHIPISHCPGSRRPAAIIGISAILFCALLLIQNVHSLAGQLTEPLITIRITSSGLEPTSVTVSPGATVRWRNTDTKPHILSSDTLRTADGLLYSTAIFPEEEFRATIVEPNSPGEHSYVSLTDPKISGTVYIEGKKNDSPLSSPTPSSLPKNPLIAQTPSRPLQNAATSHPPFSPKPFRNPETGIPLGISSLMALGIVLLLTRRILRSPYAQVIRP